MKWKKISYKNLFEIFWESFDPFKVFFNMKKNEKQEFFLKTFSI